MKASARSGRAALLLLGVVSLAAGGVIAWVDTRPGWDDTGITAGALLIVSGLASLAGLPWWTAAAIVVCPLLLAEARTVGWGLAVAPALAVAGALGGALLRRSAARGVAE
jgi:hypothetical protein